MTPVISFNDLLLKAGADLKFVRLMRHKDKAAKPGSTIFELWGGNSAEFERYQAQQDFTTHRKVKDSKQWASFVVTPEKETMFVGLYDVHYIGPSEKEIVSPTTGEVVPPGQRHLYKTVKNPILHEYEGRLYIDWGAGHVAWCQYADRHDKPIIEIKQRWADSNEGDDSAEPLFDSLDDGLFGFGEEGKKIYKLSCLRERVEGNRLNILQIKGYECEVCKYQFSKQYIGFKSHAVVHHKKPLALGTRKSANADDFAVLCAPCHVAAHMGKGRLLNPWTIEELKTKITREW